MKQITIETVKQSGWLVFETIAGSRAYGLANEQSDTDIRGVFVLPESLYFSLDYSPQVSNESNDIVYYELKRFTELLSKNNPNILELLNVPDNCVLQRHPIMDAFTPELFLSKLCEQTFANYAFSQVKKAFSLEKKIMQPMDKERKTVLDFCYVRAAKHVQGLEKFLQENNMLQEHVGLSALTHIKDCYNLYYEPAKGFKGVCSGEKANDVCLSTIPKESSPIALLYFNKEGYSTYCKTYKEYWDWVGKRNEIRFESTMAHGKKYDAKNMMHVFRLLMMAKEIAAEGSVNVLRKDRDFLLGIKHGKYEYDELIGMAERLKADLSRIFQDSSLPNSPDLGKVNEILVKARRQLYNSVK